MRRSVLFFVVTALSVNTAAATKVLMHGRVEEPSYGDDGLVFDHLVSVHGAENVSYMMGDEAASDGSSAEGFDVVILSSTMASNSIRDKYENTSVGVVNWENALMGSATAGNFMMSESGGNQNGISERTQINILDSAHPLAAGLSGTVTVFNNPQWTQYGLGGLGDGVALIAEATENPDEHSIFAADVGDALLGDGSDGFPASAAGRRVMFFLSDQGFSDLTDDGVKLFDAAVQWAGDDAGGGLLGDFNLNGLLDDADIDELSLAIVNMSNDPKYDLFRDSFLDGSDRTQWVYGLKKTYFGDSNLDGEFNSADLVFVFVAGKYETGQSAGWAAGDWNGDRIFNSGDFVQAFDDGGYEQGPRRGLAVVPEPSAVALLFLGALITAASYRNRLRFNVSALA
jgi:hypothetical protein